MLLAQDSAPPRIRRDKEPFGLPAGWWPVAFSSEISTRPVACRLRGVRLAVFRDQSGAARAVEDRCPHRRLPLSMGRVTGDGRVQCGYHGWAFDGVSGACVAIPNLAADEPLPNHRVAAYSVATANGLVFVWAGGGEPDLPVPSLATAGGARRLHTFTTDVRAPHERIAEALLWNPGRALGLSLLLGGGDEVAGARIDAGSDVDARAVAAWRERETVAFPRISTYRPLVQRTARAMIRTSVDTGVTEIAALGRGGEPRARILAALTPVGAYRTTVRLAAIARGGADLALRGLFQAARRKTVAGRIEAVADAVEDAVDPAVERLRRSRAHGGGSSR